MAQKRGTKSILPARLPDTWRREQIVKIEDFDASDILTSLRNAGWRPSAKQIYNLPVIQPRQPKSGPTSKKNSPRLRFSKTGRSTWTVEMVERGVVSSIVRAINDYLWVLKHAVPPNQFRRELKEFAAALKTFIRQIPPPNSAVRAAIDPIIQKKIMAQFPSLPDDPMQQFLTIIDNTQLADDGRLYNLAIGLRTALSATEEVRKAEGGPGRDANRAGHRLVGSLASIYEDATGKRPSRALNQVAKDEGKNPVAGPFGPFVKAVNEQIPEAFRLKDIDGVIRSLVLARHRRPG
jgi:hypothetical protein